MFLFVLFLLVFFSLVVFLLCAFVVLRSRGMCCAIPLIQARPRYMHLFWSAVVVHDRVTVDMSLRRRVLLATEQQRGVTSHTKKAFQLCTARQATTTMQVRESVCRKDRQLELNQQQRNQNSSTMFAVVVCFCGYLAHTRTQRVHDKKRARVHHAQYRLDIVHSLVSI